ncbi:DUF5313 family protein [Nocardia goodfellowii]|uniref:DUF5313 domain-containing protein n=1 Tax=Nocardia goodfellowii TaxID=882446 RepID=A0ABS4QKG6_9NOCA|nr:DUF5313 family protein [Nocardia goodfellowii]MBP2192198.1 hypothetical protein [Nocardia goodfellowii]
MAEHAPNPLQRVRYIAGATLPPSMREWVLRDQTGPGATRRFFVRFLVPPIPLLCLFLLVPGPAWMGLAMAALVYLPLVFFTIALTYVYRRHVLLKHGLDPELANEDERRRAAENRARYELRYHRD